MNPIFYRDFSSGGEKPFPYLIIEDFYDEEELGRVWRELDFLLDGDKLMGPEDTGAASYSDGTPAKQNRGLFLDNLYTNRSISNILTVNRKLMKSGIMQEISKHSLLFKGLPDCNGDDTLVSYYENKDHYAQHRDIYNFTSLHWFFKEPKKFTGGDLSFHEFDVEIPCENNKMILFPSSIHHGVSEVKMEDSDVGKGLGRFCISQFFFIDPREEDLS